MVATGKKWTEQEILDLIARADRRAIFKILWALYQRQTSQEQSSDSTICHNGVGFSGPDAKFLTSVAKGAEPWKQVTERQAPYIRKALVKYRKQLVDIANENEKKGIDVPGTEDNYKKPWGGRFEPKQMEIPNPYPTGPATARVQNKYGPSEGDDPMSMGHCIKHGDYNGRYARCPMCTDERKERDKDKVQCTYTNTCKFCGQCIPDDKKFCSEGCKVESEMHEIVRQGELEENQRAAEFKMKRNEILQNPYGASWEEVFGKKCTHDFQDYPMSAVPMLEKKWNKKYQFTPGLSIRGCHNQVCTKCGEYQFIDSSD